MLTTITPTPEEWDRFLDTLPDAHILQTSAWGALKSAYGWEAARVAVADGKRIVGGAQLLFRPLPFWLGTLAYLAMGPCVVTPHRRPHPLTPSPLHGEGEKANHRGHREFEFESGEGEATEVEEALWGAIDQCARSHGAAFLKWEPGLVEGSQLPDFARLGFRESPQTVQPPRTIVIDLSGDEAAILARMNQGTRRKIRQSQKNGIRYWEASRGEVDVFTGMMQETGLRNAFGVHEPGYYALAYDLFVPDDAALILAEHEGDPLAGVFVFAKGRTAWYFYGASSSVKRNLMAAYGVQWAAVQWAKARGCIMYDLWGIPDEDEAALEAGFESRSDGLWGVYGFKRGWGGRIVRSAGAWDRVYQSVVYAGYRLALKVRED